MHIYIVPVLSDFQVKPKLVLVGHALTGFNLEDPYGVTLEVINSLWSESGDPLPIVVSDNENDRNVLYER